MLTREIQMKIAQNGIVARVQLHVVKLDSIRCIVEQNLDCCEARIDWLASKFFFFFFCVAISCSSNSRRRAVD